MNGWMDHLRLINQESPTGFEPADKRPIGFKVKRLDHSAIVTCKQRDKKMTCSQSRISLFLSVFLCVCVSVRELLLN